MRRKSKAAELFVSVHGLQIGWPQPLLPQSPTRRNILSSLALAVFRLKHPLIYIPGDYFLPQASSTSWSSPFKFSAKESCWRTVCVFISPSEGFLLPSEGEALRVSCRRCHFVKTCSYIRRKCPIQYLVFPFKEMGSLIRSLVYDTSGSWKDASLVKMAETNRLG